MRNRRFALRYVAAKLGAIGIGWLACAAFILMLFGWHPEYVWRLLQSEWLLVPFFVYGAACSIAIDAIGHLIHGDEERRMIKLTLYVVAAVGYAAFRFRSMEATVLFGLLGSVFAVLCYGSHAWLVRRERAAYAAGASVALLLAAVLAL